MLQQLAIGQWGALCAMQCTKFLTQVKEFGMLSIQFIFIFLWIWIIVYKSEHKILSIMNTKYSISFPFVCWLHWIFQFSRFSDLISDITQAYLPWKETKSKFMNIYWSQLKYELSFKHTKWGQKKERCGNILGLLSYISYCSSL